MKVTFDLTVGPWYGAPVGPSGWVEDGRWLVNPATGQFFGIEDVAADGTVTLHDPQLGWRTTLNGQSITSFPSTPTPATPALATAAAAATADKVPLVPTPAPAAENNLVPTKEDVAKYGIFARATVPEGSPDAAS